MSSMLPPTPGGRKPSEARHMSTWDGGASDAGSMAMWKDQHAVQMEDPIPEPDQEAVEHVKRLIALPGGARLFWDQVFPPGGEGGGPGGGPEGAAGAAARGTANGGSGAAAAAGAQ